jgi:hypothetical protein
MADEVDPNYRQYQVSRDAINSIQYGTPDEQNEALNNARSMFANSGVVNNSAYDGFRQREMEARQLQYQQMQQAQGLMNGAPGQAEQQYQAGLDRSGANLMSMAASARGGGAGLAAANRNAVQQGDMMRGQGAEQLAFIRAQEMTRARGEYMAGANAMRQGDAAREAFASDAAQRAAALKAQQEAAAAGLFTDTLTNIGNTAADRTNIKIDRERAIRNADAAARDTEYQKNQAYGRFAAGVGSSAAGAVGKYGR